MFSGEDNAIMRQNKKGFTRQIRYTSPLFARMNLQNPLNRSRQLLKCFRRA